MKSSTKTFALPLLLGAVLLISGPAFGDEPKTKESAVTEKSDQTQKASAMQKNRQDKDKSDKRDIREEVSTSNKENIMLKELKK